MVRSLLCAALVFSVAALGAAEPAFSVDKNAKTITINSVMAPRKLAKFKDIYPIEVIATFAAPKGQKAHETIVSFDAKPSDIHKALVDLGVKPGKPARGEEARASGPEVELFLEFAGADGKPKKVAVEDILINTKTNQAMGKVKWHFTGSAMKNPDPEKDDVVYGADLTGTLISLFPVTDDTVFQSSLTLKEEKEMKLETDKKVLPKEGTAVKLIIQVK